MTVAFSAGDAAYWGLAIFLVLLGVVGIGVLATSISYVADAQRGGRIGAA